MTSLCAWDKFAHAPALSLLDDLTLRESEVWFVDFTTFILKYRQTLKKLHLEMVFLCLGDMDALKKFLAELATFPVLESFVCHGLWMGGGDLDFPAASEPFGRDMHDEEDYVWVDRMHSTHFSGVEEVRTGLMQMTEQVVVLRD